MKRHIMKTIVPLLLCAILVSSVGTPAFAAASDYGVSASFVKSYNEDGKTWISYAINTGIIESNASNAKTEIWAEVYNSAGKKVISWTSVSFEPNKKITRRYGYDWSKFPSGKYTFKLYVKVSGSVFDLISYVNDSETWYWSRTIDHKATAKVSFIENPHVLTDDGAYVTNFVLSQSGCKGKVIHIEVYDEWGSRVFKNKSKPVQKESGKVAFHWGGYPSDGGKRCPDGEYTIKYWVDNGNPKQTTTWITMY